jgi:hypothetical protein
MVATLLFFLRHILQLKTKAKKYEIVQACCIYHHHHPQKVKKIQNIEENGRKSMIWRIKRLKVREFAFCTFVVR